MDETQKKTPDTNDQKVKPKSAPDEKDTDNLLSLRNKTAAQFLATLAATETHNGMSLIDEEEFRRLYETNSDVIQNATTTFDFHGYVRASGEYGGLDKGTLFYKDVMATNGLLKTKEHKGIHVGTDGIFDYNDFGHKNHRMQGPNDVHQYMIYVSIPREILLEKNLADEGGHITSVGELQHRGVDNEDIERYQSAEEGWVVISAEVNPDEDPHAREKVAKIHQLIVQYIKDGNPLDKIENFVESMEKKSEQDAPSKDKAEKNDNSR